MSSCQNHPIRLEAGKVIKTFKTERASHWEFFGRKWREYGRNRVKYQRWGKSLQERARLNTIPLDFPKGEIILGVLDMPCTRKNKKEQLPAGKANQQTPNACHFALIPIGSFLEGSEMNVGGIGEIWRNWNIVCRKEPTVKMMVEHHHAGIPKGICFSMYFCQPPKSIRNISNTLFSIDFHGIFVGY